jgi:AcrR family transcriptional regulator
VEAGATHGSVRYHFGTFERLLAGAFSRQNDEMVRRQVEMYRSAAPVLEKWRLGSRELFDADLASGWLLRTYEALHLAISHPDLQEVLQPQFEAWTDLLSEAVVSGLDELDLELSEPQVRGVAMTIAYSQLGAVTTALRGGHPWHEDYLDACDDLLGFLARRAADTDEGVAP